MNAALVSLNRVAQTNFTLERAAAALAEHAAGHTALVVVVRPGDPDAAVMAHDDHARLRAAIRVAAAAGNTRAWRDLTPRIQNRPIAELPALIALAAKQDRMRTCHAAGVYAGEQLLAVALWFSRRERDSAAAMSYRTDTLRVLNAAR
jgi:hypothetical protein